MVLAFAPATWPVGVLVTALLVLGYALDAADGQLARLRGGGSLLGEWLDHMIDSVKVAALHLAVLITLYRNFDLHPAWLLVPIVFAITSSVHFFGMILVDLLGRVRRATAGLPTRRRPRPTRSRRCSSCRRTTASSAWCSCSSAGTSGSSALHLLCRGHDRLHAAGRRQVATDVVALDAIGRG